MKLVVGLGNPGKEYRGTRHNIGAEAVELLAEKSGASLKRKWRVQAWAGAARIGDRTVVLARPRTFMNLSGGPVTALMRWHRCSPAELLVVSDDINLDLGKIRIRRDGSSGGHKGLESIIRSLGTEEFARLRVGVGNPADDWVDHVLGKFSPREAAEAKRAREKAASAIEEIILNGVDAAMNRFNA
jgi:PTH1 family peptidyl-tRNA hydrolase